MMVTSLSSSVQLVARTIESYGLDAKSLFDEVGLDYLKLNDPNDRFPFDKVTELWNRGAQETGDHCFGLKVAQQWHPTAFYALGFSWLASSTLKEAFERLVRYIRVVNTGVSSTLEEYPEYFEFTLFPPSVGPKISPYAGDASIAVVVKMCRMIYGESFKPLGIRIIRDRSDCHDNLCDYCDAPIECSASNLSFLLDKNMMESRLTTANIDLAHTNDQTIVDYLAHIDSKEIGFQVRAKIMEQLPTGRISEELVASALNLSLRSLQRKLKDEGCSYQELLDSTRQDLAIKYVKIPRYTINEITYLLGFTEQSNFSRAFKRWTGVPPSVYRESVQ